MYKRTRGYITTSSSTKRNKEQQEKLKKKRLFFVFLKKKAGKKRVGSQLKSENQQEKPKSPEESEVRSVVRSKQEEKKKVRLSGLRSGPTYRRRSWRDTARTSLAAVPSKVKGRKSRNVRLSWAPGAGAAESEPGMRIVWCFGVAANGPPSCHGTDTACGDYDAMGVWKRARNFKRHGGHRQPRRVLLHPI